MKKSLLTLLCVTILSFGMIISTGFIYASANVTSAIAGDSNGDGILNISDVSTLLNMLSVGEHEHNYLESCKAATCLEDGYTAQVCAVCGHGVFAETVDALGHTAVVDPAVNATCTESGLTEGSHCETCGEVLTEQTVVDALGHSYVDNYCTECGQRDPESYLDFTTLTPLDTEGSYNYILGEFSINSGITLAGESVEKGIYIHPVEVGAENAAFLTYDIEGLGFNTFTALVGKNADDSGWGVPNPIQFEIYADGKLITKSNPLQYPDTELLTAFLPEGTKYLKLVANAVGETYFSCGSVFASPELTNTVHTHTVVVDIAVAPTCLSTGLTEGSHCGTCGEVFTAQEFLPVGEHNYVDDYCTVCGLRDPESYYDLTTLAPLTDAGSYNYIDGEFRVNENITLGTENVVKGIYVHPTYIGDENAAFLTYNIAGLDYNTFSAWVGKDAAGAGWGNNPVQFEVYADGVLIAQSAVLLHPNKELLKATIPEGTTTLKLVAKAVGNAHSACGCTFAYPGLTNTEHVHTVAVDPAVAPTCTASGLSEGNHCETCGEVITVQTIVPATGHNYVEGVCSICGVYNLTAHPSDNTTVSSLTGLTSSNVTIGTETFVNGISVHPHNIGDENAATVTYDITGSNYNFFSAWVGKAAGGDGYGNNPVQFEIYADGVMIAQSTPLTYPNKELLEANIPEDTTTLKLVAKAYGTNPTSYYSCSSTFAEPTLSVSEKIVGNKIDLTTLEYTELNTIGGEFATENVLLAGNTYAKGIYMHPLASGSGGAASISYDISALDVTTFTALVGKAGDDPNYGNKPMRFEVYADGVLIAQSSSTSFPSTELLTAEIPEGTQILKLAAVAVTESYDGHYACGATFAVPTVK